MVVVPLSLLRFSVIDKHLCTMMMHHPIDCFHDAFELGKPGGNSIIARKPPSPPFARNGLRFLQLFCCLLLRTDEPFVVSLGTYKLFRTDLQRTKQKRNQKIYSLRSPSVCLQNALNCFPLYLFRFSIGRFAVVPSLRPDSIGPVIKLEFTFETYGQEATPIKQRGS